MPATYVVSGSGRVANWLAAFGRQFYISFTRQENRVQSRAANHALLQEFGDQFPARLARSVFFVLQRELAKIAGRHDLRVA